MAKKKRKKRPHARPQTPQQAAADTGAPPRGPAPPARAEVDRPSNRQLRKEQARIERERRLRQARRRLRVRRLVRWGVPLVLIGAVVTFFVYRAGQQGREFAAARAAFGCGEVELQQDELDEADARGASSPPTIHAEPFAEGENGVPATAGAHSTTLPPEPHVYDQPVPEANVVHNLEHGYVLIYYASEGDSALADDLRARLETVAEDETEVIMAPYDGLASPVAFVSWGQLLTCTPPDDAGPGEAEAVAQGFIEEYRNSSLAPEPGAG